MKHVGTRHLVPALLALCALLYLPGLWSVPVTDRDEARFAQATRQMIERKDWISIRFQDEARNKKPALTHWVQGGLVCALTGEERGGVRAGIGWYRLASVLGATLSVVLLPVLWGARLDAQPIGWSRWMAAALLASSILVIVEARLATSDALLLAAVVTAQCSLWRLYIREGSGWQWVVLFWIAMGLGILTKGLILPIVSLLTVGTLCIADRSWGLFGRLRVWAGTLMVVVMVGPWVWTVQQATDGAFLREALGQDFWMKVVSAQESHGLPPGFYLVTLPVLMWPGSLLTGLAIGQGWRNRSRSCERFLLAWIVPMWLVLEIVPTKLPQYALPLYPALCLLTARCVAEGLGRPGGATREGWKKLMPRIGFGAWCVIGIGIAAAPLAGLWVFGDEGVGAGWVRSGFGVFGALCAAGLVVLAVRCDPRRRMIGVTAISIAAVVPMVLTTFVVALPGMDVLWVSRAVAGAVQDRGQAVKSVAVFGYHEPSVVFECGTATRLATWQGPGRDPLSGLASPVMCFVPAGAAGEEIVEGLTGGAYRTIGPRETVIEGFNYSKGQRVPLEAVILERAEAAAGEAGDQ